jgi:hypothetical protein
MRLVMKDATWRDGQLQTQFEEPFENLRRSNQLSRTKHEENGMRNAHLAPRKEWGSRSPEKRLAFGVIPAY